MINEVSLQNYFTMKNEYIEHVHVQLIVKKLNKIVNLFCKQENAYYRFQS